MVGRFLLGLVSGGALVAVAFVVGAALFPISDMEAASDPDALAATAPEPAIKAPETAAPKPTDEATATPEPVPATEPAEATTEAPADTALAALPGEAPSPTPGLEPAPSSAQPSEGSSPSDPKPEAETAGIAAEPAPAAPEAPAPSDESLPDVPADLGADVAVAPATPGIAAVEPDVAANAAPPADQPAVALPAPDSASQPAPEAAPEPAVVAEVPPAPPPVEPSPEAPATAMPAPDVADLPGTPPALLPDPDVAALPAPTTDPTFESAPGLDADDGVVVGRLPRVGDTPEATEDTAEAPPEDPRPLIRFAEPFENPEGKPLLSVVLIDPGTDDLDRAALAALPYPVALALDPLDPATPERVAIYRAGGKEVVMLATGIAEGAQASDIEVAFQEMGRGLPEAVAVMDLAQVVFQSSRPLASLVVPVVGAQGRGLLTWDQGLNAADQVARRDEVPAAVIFRDFATGGNDRGAIRRLLDRAVFKAGQDGRVVLAGTASADLVAALLEWTVEGRAATVAFAPVSAVLTVE